MDQQNEPEFTDEELEAGRILFAGACDFMLGVAQLSQLPAARCEEIAFAGRSNVGKSSLVNALTGRKTLARTSNTPGRTQELNYFNLADRLYMVDMPGYGYAKVSKDKVENWTKLIFAYLRGRPTLRCVFILVDARHGLKESDLELMKMLDGAAVSYRIILTKIDKVKNAELQRITQGIESILQKNPAAFPKIIGTSSHEGTGIAALRATILQFAQAKV